MMTSDTIKFKTFSSSLNQIHSAYASDKTGSLLSTSPTAIQTTSTPTSILSPLSSITSPTDFKTNTNNSNHLFHYGNYNGMNGNSIKNQKQVSFGLFHKCSLIEILIARHLRYFDQSRSSGRSYYLIDRGEFA